MAHFTMTLESVIEDAFGETMDPTDFEQDYSSFTFAGVTYGKLPTVPDPTVIGLGTYPIFDEEYRPILNGKIIDEYFKREIGVETPDMFFLVIRRKMDQIMPYYNKLYETERIKYDALDTMRIHSVSKAAMTGEEEATGHNTTTSETESKGRAVASQTPQTMLASNADYATSATDSESDSDVSGESSQESTSSNSTESNSDNLVTGYQGIASDLIVKYRNSLLNIDTMILYDLQDCFMQILDNGDAYTSQGWIY